MYKLYSIIATVSVLIRQFVLPNPFEPPGETFNIALFNITFPLTPDIANWIAEPLLHIVTFSIVGIYYRKGQHEPAFGSFLYLLFYAVHVGLIHIVSCFGFAWAAIIIIIFIYGSAHIAVNVLRNSWSVELGEKHKM